MQWVDWIITVVPVTIILFLAVYSRKYVRGVVDFLAAGRVAGRYVISAGDLTAGLSVITLVALVDLRKLFRDLAARIDNPLDNGMVEGYVSLVDKAKFEARGQGEQKDQ